MKIKSLLITALLASSLSSVAQAESTQAPAILATLAADSMQIMNVEQQIETRGEYSGSINNVYAHCARPRNTCLRIGYDVQRSMYYANYRINGRGYYTYNH